MTNLETEAEQLREIQRLNAHINKLDAEIERLTGALTPFALNAKAVSLRDALGHISREDLLRARAVLERKP